MKAGDYLERALGGNMNISTLKLKFWVEIMEEYHQYRDLLTGVKKEESLKQQIENLPIGQRLDLLDEFCFYCGDVKSETHACPNG